MTEKSPSTSSRFVIYKAGAGSGKTFTLVREFLKLALAGPERDIATRFRSILAITFTNKAANGMKDRILTSLADIAAHGAAAPMGQSLLDALNALPDYAARPLADADLRRMAQALFSVILHHYSDLSVLTIDSFVHRIVRTFAHDLGQPVNFEVQVDNTDLVRMVVDELMAQVGTDGAAPLTDTLVAFAQASMDSDQSYNLDERIAQMARQLFEEGADRHIASLADLSLADFRAYHDALSADMRAFADPLRDLGRQAAALVAGTGASKADVYSGGSYLNFFNKLADGDFGMPGSKVVKAMEDGKMASDKCPDGVRDALDALQPRLCALYSDAVARLEQGLADHNARRLLLQSVYSMSLLAELNRLLHTISHDNEVLPISEFNRLINNIVVVEDTPFIYERLGNRYRHFLIDEFQDTSVLQWHNLVPLVENGVSQGHESLVVGDAKQAIYRFRQGNVQQFIDLPRVEGLPRHGRVLAWPGVARSEVLQHNRRTFGSVIDFNNAFFSWAVRNRFAHNALVQRIFLGTGADGGLRPEGDEELRQLKHKPHPGRVELTFHPADGDDNRVYAHIAALIARLHDEEGYAYRDIFILARGNDRLAEIGEYLKAHGNPPQTSSESFTLRRSQAVMAVVAAMRCLLNQRDRAAALDLLSRLHSLGIVADDPEALFVGGARVDLEAALAAAGIDFRPPYLLSLDLYDMAELLVRDLRLADRDTLYVASLLNRVAAFTTRHGQSLSGFVEWFDQQPKLSAANSDQLDAVTLMTIHKSKGLERPVVIVPLFKRDNEAKSLHLWVDLPPALAARRGDDAPAALPEAYVTLPRKQAAASSFAPVDSAETLLEEADYLNLLYVAMTRPIEQLHLVCEEPPKRGEVDRGLPRLLMDFRDECHPRLGGDEPRPAAGGDEAPARRAVALSSIAYADWPSRVSFAAPDPDPARSLMASHLRFGLDLHDLMARVAAADELDAVLAAFFAARPMPDDERDRLAAAARALVAHPDVAPFFARGVKVLAERWILDGDTLRRPDRVVVMPDGSAAVLDYKSGSDNPQYHTQVAAYCDLLRRAGMARVDGFLLFTQPEVRLLRVV